MVIFTKGQHAKSKLDYLAFNHVLFRKSLRTIISGGNGDILLAVTDKGRIRGLLIAWCESLTWNHKKYATDLMFVAEQGGDMLLRAFKQWAMERDCYEIGLGTFNTFKDRAEDRIEKLYNRIGFETTGRTYRMRLFGI